MTAPADVDSHPAGISLRCGVSMSVRYTAHVRYHKDFSASLWERSTIARLPRGPED